MAIFLSCGSITKFGVVASSALPNDSSPPSLSHKPHISNIKPNKLPKGKQQQILEIERAIGAGIFRDRDVNSEAAGEKASLFGNILSNSVGKNEGPVEKRLRETGEWLLHQTETTSRSAGKQILVSIFVWMIPLWISAFVVASGALRLPFHTPFLDDLIS